MSGQLTAISFQLTAISFQPAALSFLTLAVILSEAKNPRSVLSGIAEELRGFFASLRMTVRGGGMQSKTSR